MEQVKMEPDSVHCADSAPSTEESQPEDTNTTSKDETKSEVVIGKKGQVENESHENGKRKAKEEKPSTKVVIRRLPPSMTKEVFEEQVSPLPPLDYMYFVPADFSLGVNAFSRAYLNFIDTEDLLAFRKTFDGYVFLDSKGQEYPAIVEFAPFQRIPKTKPNKKKDNLMGTIESDPAYIAFKEALQVEVMENTKPGSTVKQHYFETEASTTPQEEVTSTPLLDFLKQRRAEKARIKEERREEKKRKEAERKQKLRTKEKKVETEEEMTEVKVKSKQGDKEGTESEEKARQQTETLKRVFGLIPDKVLQSSNSREKKEGKEKDFRPRRREEKKEKDTRSKEFKNRTGKIHEEKTKTVEKKKSSVDAGQEGAPSTSGEKKTRVFESKSYSRNQEGDKSDGEKKNSVRGFNRKDKSDAVKKNEKRPKDKFERKRSKISKTAIIREEENFQATESAHEKTSVEDKLTKKHQLITRRNSYEVKGSEEEVKQKLRRSSLDDTDKRKIEEIEVSAQKNEKSERSSKDPRTERRIRNKDRPTMEIYRPGMGRFSKQRMGKEKVVTGSSTEIESPSHSPSPSVPVDYRL